MARSWSDGKARYTASLVEKPLRTSPAMHRISSPEEYSVTMMAAYGSRAQIRASCIYTREDWMCLHNLGVFRAILSFFFLTIGKGIFGRLPLTGSTAFATFPSQHSRKRKAYRVMLSRPFWLIPMEAFGSVLVAA